MSKAGPVLGYNEVDSIIAGAVTVPDYEEPTWRPEQNPMQAQIGNQSVIFFWKPRMDPVLTKLEGRPRYLKKPYVRITQPGDRENVIIREAWVDETESNIMADNVRFKDKYQRLLDHTSKTDLEGTPLEMWPAVGPEIVQELKHHNIVTVEGLASLPDGSPALRFLPIRSLQRLAKDFLEAASDGAVVTKLHGELDEVKDQLKQRDGELQRQAKMIDELRMMVQAQQAGAAMRSEPVFEENPTGPSPEPLPPPSLPSEDEAPKRSFLKPRK